MTEIQQKSPALAVQSAEEIAVVYAGDYVNKLSGQRIERECRLKLEAGCRALVINFRDTELVNSIGVSILLGVIDIAEQRKTPVVFSEASHHTVKLFDLLGLTRHVILAESESAARATLSEFFATTGPQQGH
ncbi:MAG TPA: STAS domain-containing protein [Pyrinomonadaceae bacterium]|jgi:anti-anti-sigma regulatory factor|nr:STAS domain-containing protein [Pyrinomonadaceae bacterium]